jgi:NAD(P)-dependent dehydrogenase (short-subunit alcohol dehydrogenase family)
VSSYFNQKVVVITGGCGGLGRALTERLVRQGAKVGILDVTASGLETTPQVKFEQVDLTNELQVTSAIREIRHELGDIDILINNAGITHMSTFEHTSNELIQKIMDVNFMGSVYATRACIDSIIQQHGHIVAISSVAGFAPLYGRSAYAASKFAMEGFFRTLGSELEEYSVKVNIICPSFVNTRPELKAKANSGVASPGAAKKQQGKGLTPDHAASQILNAIEANKDTLYLGLISKVARWLYKFLPRVYLKKMTRDAKVEFK